MFNRKFKVEVIRTDCNVTTTIYMKGTKKQLKKDIEMYKEMSNRYEMFGKTGMVIWTDRAV